MSKLDINEMRKLAGLPLLTEMWDRDDDGDDDPDVKIATSDKRQREFEKRNKPEIDAAKKAMADKTKQQREEAAKKKEAAKAEEKPAAKPADKKPDSIDADKDGDKKEPMKKAIADKKAEEKPAEKREEAPVEAKKRGAKPNENSKSQRALAWIKSNSGSRRGEFLKWAKENLDMSSAYASAFFARHNPKSARKPVTECFVLVHPHMPSFLLAENRELNQYQWVDPTSPLDPVTFDTLAEAEKMANYMSEWRSQSAMVEKIVFED